MTDNNFKTTGFKDWWAEAALKYEGDSQLCALRAWQHQQKRIEHLEKWQQAQYADKKVLIDRIEELEALTDRQVKRTGKLTGQVDGLLKENKRLDAALDTCNQMILEVAHAQRSGADWYTKGGSGLHQQVSMWIRKASDAIKKARAGE